MDQVVSVGAFTVRSKPTVCDIGFLKDQSLHLSFSRYKLFNECMYALSDEENAVTPLVNLDPILTQESLAFLMLSTC